MALPISRSDREFQKFVADGSGDVATRVVIEGSGLTSAAHTGTSTTITHNLGWYPIVQIFVTATGQVNPTIIVTHDSVNAFTVTSAVSIASTILYR